MLFQIGHKGHIIADDMIIMMMRVTWVMTSR